MSTENTGSALARALAKAQGAMRSASKDKTNPHFKNTYATLASVWDACREPLSSNGLAVVQLVTADDKASVTVETRLLHEGGESVSSTLTMPVSQATAQGVGSAITYARRYALAALVGVAPDDDDDGNEASKAPPRRESNDAPPSPPSPPSNVVQIQATASEWEARMNSAQSVPALAEVGNAFWASPLKGDKVLRALFNARMSALAAAEKARGDK